MTWIYGWPFHTDFAHQYAQDRRLFPNESNLSNLAIINDVASDLLRRSGLPFMDVSLRTCWVDNELACVSALYINDRAQTIERARKTVRVSPLPRRDCAFRLGALMGYEGPPRWYQYADGSWNPRDGVIWVGSEEESDSESDSSEEEGEDEDEEGSETQRGDEGESTEVEAAEDDASETFGRTKVGADDRRTYASVGIQVEDAPSGDQLVRAAKCAGELGTGNINAP